MANDSLARFPEKAIAVSWCEAARATDAMGNVSTNVHVTPISMSVMALPFLIGADVLPGYSQSNPDLQAFIRQDSGLSQDQIASIRSGQAFAKNLHSPNSDEIFVFGAVYIDAAPESRLKFSRIRQGCETLKSCDFPKTGFKEDLISNRKSMCGSR